MEVKWVLTVHSIIDYDNYCWSLNLLLPRTIAIHLLDEFIKYKSNSNNEKKLSYSADAFVVCDVLQTCDFKLTSDHHHYVWEATEIKGLITTCIATPNSRRESA